MIIDDEINNISKARTAYINQVEQLNEVQAAWKPAHDVWNAVEITEHLYWAEQGAIAGMWKTLYGIREGKVERTYEFDHKGMPIQEIIDLTWKEKEMVPPVAAPRIGGPISLWITNLQSLQYVLNAFCSYIKEDELRLLAHPHPISGALDFQQRLEFLAFHLNRHHNQVTHLVKQMNEAEIR